MSYVNKIPTKKYADRVKVYTKLGKRVPSLKFRITTKITLQKAPYNIAIKCSFFNKT